MFRKYKKTFRIQHDQRKKSLSKSDIKKLLNGRITIEEKIDGANTGIIGGKNNSSFRLQKRGSLIDISEHPQFGRFKAWSNEHYDNLIKIFDPFIMYGEFMWATHHIFYDSLPDWFICFDIWNGIKFVNRQEKEQICRHLNIEIVPLLFEGYIDEISSYIIGPSAYSTNNLREGIVVKNYKNQMRGKIVNQAFTKEVDEDNTHWMTKWDPTKLNKLYYKIERFWDHNYPCRRKNCTNKKINGRCDLEQVKYTGENFDENNCLEFINKGKLK